MLKRLFICFFYYYKYYVDNEEIQNIIYYNFKFLNDIILFFFPFQINILFKNIISYNVK